MSYVKCSICKKVFDTVRSTPPIILFIDGTKIYFCKKSHLVEYVKMNFMNMASEMFSKRVEQSLTGDHVDPEYIAELEENPNKCQGAVAVSRKDANGIDEDGN